MAHGKSSCSPKLGAGSGLSSATSFETVDQLSSLNSNDLENQDDRAVSSHQPISENDANAYAPSDLRTHDEGPRFLIEKKKGAKSDGVHLDEFPNGKTSLAHSLFALLICFRGLNTYSVPFACYIFICDGMCFSSFL